MSLRKTFDLSAYLVVGPENCRYQSFEQIIRSAIEAGFGFIQIRSKHASARQLIELTRQASDIIAQIGQSDRVALVVNDRLDVVLAAREAGIRVDGIHVGQNDIPVAVCRKYLGPEAIIGLTARTNQLLDYVTSADVTEVDYLGTGPLHATATKPEAGLAQTGQIITRSLEELNQLARISPRPVVVGGGVRLSDIKALKQTGVSGFFVVSAVTGAADPGAAARELIHAWQEANV